MRAEMAHHPCLLGGPHMGTKSELATPHLPSRGSPIEGDKIRSGYSNPAFSGAQTWADWLLNPCLIYGTKSPPRTSEVRGGGTGGGGVRGGDIGGVRAGGGDTGGDVRP